MGPNHNALPNLTQGEAIELLQIHCGTWPDPADPRLESGLLFSLRAWNGQPNSGAFHEVMACIKALGPTFSQTMIPSRQLGDLWGLLYLGNCYVSDPARIEHRNKLARTSDDAFSIYDAFLAEQGV